MKESQHCSPARFAGTPRCACLLLAVLTTTAGMTNAQSFVPSEWTLIAHYPLTASIDDTTCNNGPLETKSAPFENGGLFLNGIGTRFLELDFSAAETPRLHALNFDAFAMTTEFNTDSLHANPLLVGGPSWRWAGIWIRVDSLMDLEVNNHEQSYPSSLRWTPGVWHEAGLLVDGDTVSVYLDGELGVKVAATLTTADDRRIGYADGSRGTIFYGTVRNLKVYTESPIGIGIDRRDEVPSPKILLSVYPNPAGGAESISVFSAADVFARISLLDVLGRLIWNLGTVRLNVGANRLPSLPSGLRNGLYIVRVEAGDRAETRSLIIAR